jgi:hypothetical protein
MASILASLPAFVPTSPTTVNCKNARRPTSARSFRTCAKLQYEQKQSTPTSGQLLVRLSVPAKHSPPKSMPAKLRRPFLITRVGMTVPTSPAAPPATAPYVAMGVADLTHGPLLRTAVMSSSVLTRATLEFTRMQRRRLNESAISGRRSSRTPRSARILPPPTTVTSTTQARSAFGSRSSSLYPLLPMPPGSAHQSLA